MGMFMEMNAESTEDVADKEEPSIKVIKPFLHVLKTGTNCSGIFLATYAAAALVNLSSGSDTVKTLLISNGVTKIVADLLKMKDDELTWYTLMLATNLTKEPHFRHTFSSEGLPLMLYDMLTSSYHQVTRDASDKDAPDS